jgi:YVTN family beta-propeller protein
MPPRTARRVIGPLVGSGPHGLSFTPDGRLLYVAVNNAQAVVVVDTATDQVVARVAVPGQADELALGR